MCRSVYVIKDADVLVSIRWQATNTNYIIVSHDYVMTFDLQVRSSLTWRIGVCSIKDYLDVSLKAVIDILFISIVIVGV